MNEVRIHKTGAPEVIQSSDGRLTLSVPIQFKRRAGRKQVTLPSGEPGKPRPWDSAATALQLALARGHRWLRMLESGNAKSLREIAALEGVATALAGEGAFVSTVTLPVSSKINAALTDNLDLAFTAGRDPAETARAIDAQVQALLPA